jgi:uncharacterized membrane protein
MNFIVYHQYLFANLLGTFLVVLGLIFACRHRYYEKIFQQTKISGVSVIVLGVFFLWAGIYLLQSNHVWSWSPRVALTIVSWFVFVTSIFMILMPDKAIQLFYWLMRGKNLVIMNLIFVALGLLIVVDAAKVTYSLINFGL